MKKIITLFFAAFQLYAFAQQVKITELKIPIANELFGSGEDTVLYPIIMANSDAANKKMNDCIRKTFVDNEYINKPIETGLDSAISNGLISMSYEITFNQKNILSLTIEAQGCGAYCSNWRTFFNFNTETGNTITIQDILTLDKKSEFEKNVLKRKKEELIAHETELAEDLKKNEIDQDTYNWAKELIDSSCMQSISLDQFSLSVNELEIIDDCEFPHVIRSLEPAYKLNYTHTSIKMYLKPEWENILLK